MFCVWPVRMLFLVRKWCPVWLSPAPPPTSSTRSAAPDVPQSTLARLGRKLVVKYNVTHGQFNMSCLWDKLIPKFFVCLCVAFFSTFSFGHGHWWGSSRVSEDIQGDHLGWVGTFFMRNSTLSYGLILLGILVTMPSYGEPVCCQVMLRICEWKSMRSRSQLHQGYITVSGNMFSFRTNIFREIFEP